MKRAQPKQKRKLPKPAEQANGLVPPCPRFTAESVKELDVAQLMCSKFKWTLAQDFQVQGTCAQLTGTNVVVHASTGSGKTAIAAGPHAVPAMKGRVTLFVAPLLALHTEMTKTFKDKYGLSAIAINSLIEGGTKKIFKEIINGEYQVVILAPEMLLHRRFVDTVLKSQRFRRRILSVVIDEAHCISHWGDSFRKLYGAIGMIRAFLLPRTPIVAMSGTLTCRVRRHICKKLGFSSDGANFVFIDKGNARPNISIASLPMRHPAESFRDADIAIPPNIHQAEDIVKAFIYSDDKDTIYSMVDHLRSRLPPSIDPGVIRPFTASHSAKYRADAMAAFHAGTIRVLVCTEAAGMGCDIPDVDLTIQWKTARLMSGAVQRGGRTARSKNRTGVFIMFNEAASYKVNPTEPLPPTTTKPKPKPRPEPNPKSKRKRKHQGEDLGPETPAESSGASTQRDFGFKSAVPAEPELHDNSPGEGIYCFVQTTLCRRKVWDKVFGNTHAYTLTAPCCDLCDSSFLDRFHFTPPQKATRAPRISKGETSRSTVQALKAWRDSTFERDYPTATWDATAFMADSLIDTLASVKPTTSLEVLTASLNSQWAHWKKYGCSVYEIISSSSSQQESTSSKAQSSTDASVTQIQAPMGSALTPRPRSGAEAQQPKRPRLPTSSQPPGKPRNRKGKGKLAIHEMVFDDWGIQPMLPTDETQAQEQTQATQTHSHSSKFSVSRPSSRLSVAAGSSSTQAHQCAYHDSPNISARTSAGMSHQPFAYSSPMTPAHAHHPYGHQTAGQGAMVLSDNGLAQHMYGGTYLRTQPYEHQSLHVHPVRGEAPLFEPKPD